MNIVKAKILDAILLKFDGNITIQWSKLQNGEFNDIAIYDTIEKNVNYLIHDKKLERNVHGLDVLSLTDGGYATMGDLENLGYEATARKERNNRRWAIAAGIITVLTFLILVYDTWFNKPKANPSPTETVTPSKIQHETPSGTDKVSAKKETATVIADTTSKQNLQPIKQVQPNKKKKSK